MSEAELTVIRWRDIPAQVVARAGDSSARALMPQVFQEAIDAAAMVARLTESDDYMTNFQMDRRPCNADLETEVQAELARLTEEWPDDVLRATIRSGGLRQV